jgi:hypothetical protein
MSTLWQRLATQLELVGVQLLWVQGVSRLLGRASGSARAEFQMLSLHAGQDGDAQGGVTVYMSLIVGLIVGPCVLLFVCGFVSGVMEGMRTGSGCSDSCEGTERREDC